MENAQQLVFGKNLEGLRASLRAAGDRFGFGFRLEALPAAFGDVEIDVEAVRNISSALGSLFT